VFTWSPDERTAIRLLGLAVGPRTDSRDGSVVLDDYFFAQLSARRQIGERLRCVGRIDNLLDQQYEEATGFAAAGLSFYAGVELRQ
jgi:outer membrane cobalamin receptor